MTREALPKGYDLIHCRDALQVPAAGQKGVGGHSSAAMCMLAGHARV